MYGCLQQPNRNIAFWAKVIIRFGKNSMSYSVQFIGNYTELGGKFHTREQREVLTVWYGMEKNRRIPQEL